MPQIRFLALINMLAERYYSADGFPEQRNFSGAINDGISCHKKRMTQKQRRLLFLTLGQAIKPLPMSRILKKKRLPANVLASQNAG